MNEYKTIKCRLDGKQTISIPVDIKQNGLYVEAPLDVIVRGFLKFDETSNTVSSNSLVDKTVVYPVLFTTGTIRVNNGRCVITLFPRSEDLFEETKTVKESASISDSSIVSQGGIKEDEQITDPLKEPVIIKVETGVIRNPYKLSIEVTITSVNNINFYAKTVDRGTSPQTEVSNDVRSLFQKEKVRIPSNIIIDCYNDSDWIPAVDDILGDNNATTTEILDALENLENSTPFGMSPMYDGVVASSRILNDSSINNYRKTMYVLTDNEANISMASVENAINEVNDIDGDKKTPVLIANMAVVEPSTLSVRANTSDTKNINKLSFLTGGQALTVVDDNYLDDVVGIFYRESVGSMGYGTYEFISDLGEEVSVNQITAFFDIPTTDSSATWSIETSIDGYNYTIINDSYSSSENVDFKNLRARYIRFKIILITAFTSMADEYGAYPETPSLTSIRILYNSYNISYLYLNKEDVDVPPYQITMAVDANEVNDDQIEVGVAKSDAHSWVDFSTESQPTVDQNGKIVIPLRFSQDTTVFQQEPLAQVDMFTLKTEYGRFDYWDTVILYDKNDEVIPTDYYKLQPRNGLIVFNTALPTDYVDGDYKVGIINDDQYKIGLKFTNKSSNEGIEMYGVSYLFSTDQNLLTPLAKTAPEARLVEIEGDIFDRFEIIQASYVYYDANFEPEDTSQRSVRWHINGLHISYLDNLMSWNDITNPADPVYVNTALSYPSSLESGETIEDWAKKQSASILTIGDKVHYTIQVSDGLLNSNKVKSNIVSIGGSIPLIGQIRVMAEYQGEVGGRISPDRRVVISPPLEEVFFGDGKNQSEITWIVNDQILKSGIYGESTPEGVSPVHEVWPSEIGGYSGGHQDYALRITNSISVRVTPVSNGKVGNLVISETVVVENSLPQIENANYTTTVFRENSDVVVNFSFLDYDIHFTDNETSQFDQTNIKWYRKRLNEPDFELVYSFNDPDSGNFQEIFYVEEYRNYINTNLGTHTSTVSSSILSIGQNWYCELLPADSIDYGAKVTTKIISITPSN